MGWRVREWKVGPPPSSPTCLRERPSPFTLPQNQRGHTPTVGERRCHTPVTDVPLYHAADAPRHSMSLPFDVCVQYPHKRTKGKRAGWEGQGDVVKLPGRGGGARRRHMSAATIQGTTPPPVGLIAAKGTNGWSGRG